LIYWKKVYEKEYAMGNIYHSIMEGLSEAIEDAQSGGKKLKRRVVSVVPVKEYNVEEYGI
jgi:putative transcriptional regulator